METTNSSPADKKGGQAVREMFAARLSPLAKAIIKAESAGLGLSEAGVVEMWAYAHCKTPDSKKMILDEAKRSLASPAISNAMGGSGTREIVDMIDRARKVLESKGRLKEGKQRKK